jgi:hypothetical protein
MGIAMNIDMDNVMNGNKETDISIDIIDIIGLFNKVSCIRLFIKQQGKQ